MERYKNLNGNSDIRYYEMWEDFIWIIFSDNVKYQYTYDSIGAGNVERMKELAIAGRGLTSFINTQPGVRNGYAQKAR